MPESEKPIEFPEPEPDEHTVMVDPATDLNVFLDSLWKNQVSENIKRFVMKFFTFLIRVVGETENFISVVKALDYLYSKGWNGLILVKNELEIAIFPDKIVFSQESRDETHHLKIMIDDLDQLTGSAGEIKVQGVIDFLLKLMQQNRHIVHAFPETPEDLAKNIPRFNAIS